MLIAVCSLKGSPGVTSWAVALAACWPPPARAVLVECDPSGGSVAARFGLPSTPGLVSLAAAARRDTTAGLLWSHTQALPSGLPVVAAPPGADYTRAALHTLQDSRRQAVSVVRGAAAQGAVVIADCGRLDSTSPAVPIARNADHVLLLTRPLADELTNLAAGLSMVDLWSMRPGLLLVGPGYPANEVTRELGVPVLAAIPQDLSGARALCGHSGAKRGPARSRLSTAARQVATRLSSPRGAPLPPAGHERPTEHIGAKSGPWQAITRDLTPNSNNISRGMT
jgi:hypothetical protein